jgi:sugar (pentulose or hexulose) kinase
VPPETFLGIDVGTSAVKAAAFDADGKVMAAARARLPRLEVHGDAAVQPLGAVLIATEQVVQDVTHGIEPALAALVTQRDTAIALDANEECARDLISWRDGRHRQCESVWDALAAEPGHLPEGPIRVRSLLSFLVERWTGVAAETEGTLSRHLAEPALCRLRQWRGDVDVPCIVSTEEPISTRPGCALPAGIPLFLSSGDKNAELLGAGVTGTSSAGLSLGSAISLGVTVSGGRPEDVPGCVITRAALRDAWNVETGLATGMDGLDVLRKWCGRPDLVPDARWRTDLWMVPTFAGAIDNERATGLIDGMRPSTTIEDLARAWAQGVACELARLMTRIDAAAGPVEELRIHGGGADALWQRLLADVMDLPVRLLTDPWCGARGSVLAALIDSGRQAQAEALMDVAEALLTPAELPDRTIRPSVIRYREHYDSLMKASRA